MGKTLDTYIEELLKIKEEYGGDIPLIKVSENYELRGNMEEVKSSRNVTVLNVKKENQTFTDDFDHEPYTVEVFVVCSDNEPNKIKALLL